MKIISIILLIMLVMLQYHLWLGNGSLTHVRHLEQTRQMQIIENQQLRERNQALAAEVTDLKHGNAAIEERARSEMGMIAKDETFFHVIHKSDHSQNQTE